MSKTLRQRGVALAHCCTETPLQQGDEDMQKVSGFKVSRQQTSHMEVYVAIGKFKWQVRKASHCGSKLQ